MIKRIKHISVICVFMLSMTLLIIGCTPAKRPLLERDQVDVNRDRINDLDVTDKGAPMPLHVTLENEIEKMAGIKNAVVILGKNTAYVGIEAHENTNINNMKGLQAQIASKVRTMMPDIERIYITSDGTSVDKLRNYREQINKGKPIGNFMDEIENIF